MYFLIMNTPNTYDTHQDLVENNPKNPNVDLDDGKDLDLHEPFVTQVSNEQEETTSVLSGLKEKLLGPTQAEMTS